MVGCTQEIWFGRTMRAFSLLLAGDYADDVDENHEDDNYNEDGHLDIWSYGG